MLLEPIPLSAVQGPTPGLHPWTAADVDNYVRWTAYERGLELFTGGSAYEHRVPGYSAAWVAGAHAAHPDMYNLDGRRPPPATL